MHRCSTHLHRLGILPPTQAVPCPLHRPTHLCRAVSAEQHPVGPHLQRFQHHPPRRAVGRHCQQGGASVALVGGYQVFRWDDLAS